MNRKSLLGVLVIIALGVGGFMAVRYTRQVSDQLTAGTDSAGGGRPRVRFVKNPRVIPELTMTTLDGKTITNKDLAGKVTIFNFWATWCAPCRDEMPSIQELKRKLSGRPFVVLAVNLDEPESRIRNFLAQVKVDFTVLLDPERQVAKAWQARVLPASFVIGPDGRIRYSLVGEINWDHDLVVSRIAELMPSKAVSSE
jgi:peroxiredoxin